MPSSTACCAEKLSMPKTASTVGLSLLRISWLSTMPASPGETVEIVYPDSSSNLACTSSSRVKESWVSTVTVSAASRPPEPAC